MKTIKKIWNHSMLQGQWKKCCLLAFIVLQVCFLVICCYKYHLTSAMFESDAASEVLLAENLYENGRWFLSDDWYYSTEIRVLHNQLLMAPLFAITEDYNLIYTISFGGSLILILGAAYFCMRSYGLSPSGALTALLFLLIPYGFYRRYSPFSMELMNQFYSFFLLNVFLYLGLFQQFKNADKKISRNILAVILLAFSVLLGTCGVRYGLILFVPLAVAEVAEIWLEKGQCAWGRKSYGIALLAGYLGGGVFLYDRFLLVRYGGTVDYVSDFVYAPFSAAWDQFMKVLNSLLESLGFSMESGNIFSALGIINGVFFLYTLGFFVSLRVMAGRMKNMSRGRRYYLVFALLQFGINLGVLIFSQLRDTGGVNRYVWLGMIALLPVLSLWESPSARRGVCLLGVILCCLGNIQIYAATHRGGALAQSYGEEVFVSNYRGMLPEERSGYMAFLRENQYQLGCATFSHANISTVLMNGDVRFITVNGDADLTPMEWLASKSLAARREEAEFLLLTQAERQTRMEAGMALPGEVVYEDALYVIYDWRGK